MHHDQATAETKVSYPLSLVWWPLLYFGALVGAGFAFASTAPIMWFNAVYAALLGAIFLLERTTPHRAEWLEHDGELLNDIGHTLLTKGAAQLAIAATSIVPMAVATVTRTEDHVSQLWPTHSASTGRIALRMKICSSGAFTPFTTASSGSGS